ncbi:NAD(P)-dependent dehydrogenase, short-chain alcohol dehydrogenase family [Methylobacterium sp. 190mf]|uniref:SDR family NAD(P)-dependent oxidoreductase n=1 Tax=Methylobacterium sp. 190mf TaxID=1761798 RepID=UPI00089F7CB6|nr:SDR family NAD(P)-dependent oxidoreductase [Methylobacterium sp. 190mf]SEG66575.1 NAD(P)-dependent dehydrogenase, short-chain alcohol dehydrogenase family [Methylobacterium sp. 190mf]
MARILITGSSDGLGLMAGQRLARDGHAVVLHARNNDRGEAARRSLPDAIRVVIGDVATIAGMRSVAEQANAIGRFDAVIHNVGIGYREARRIETEDGLCHLFAINVLAPYLLTALVEKPDRLVYLSSGMHPSGIPDMDDLQWTRRRWSGPQAYAETKFLDVLLAFGVARRWPAVRSNALEPGWVPTRMGGPGAPDDMAAAPVTQAWLAVGDDPATHVTGRYFYHQREKSPEPGTRSVDLQEALFDRCASLSGVPLP